LAGQRAVQAGLDDGPQRQAVACAHEVDRRPHQRDAYRGPVGEQPRQLGVLEAGHPGPQADVRRGGLLGLHADQMLDRGRGRHRLPVEQHLAREQGPIEGAVAQNDAGHPPKFSRTE
jgi:hypothetical protein